MEMYAERRRRLADAVREQYLEQAGVIVLFAAYEGHRVRFWQDSTFWYFTGINEPAAVCTIDLSGYSTLYIAQYSSDRSLWVDVDAIIETGDFDAIEFLGEPMSGYSAQIPVVEAPHAYILGKIRTILEKRQKIYMCMPHKADQFRVQKEAISSWSSFIPNLFSGIVDIASIVSRMRRIKSTHELLLLQSAVSMTEHAHRRASKMLAPGVSESVVYAELEYEWLARGARAAFPAIVGSGYRSTVLHYDRNNGMMYAGDVVVVDCGAAVEGYCADISRTYPVSGEFSVRQRELYERVVSVYAYVAAQVKPGMWLMNTAEQTRSLHHIAVAEFKKYALDQFFLHGIGHFLGLDVHDVGDRAEPLQEGDVITIEPGLYLRDERIGVRIEDDFVLTATGVRCLGNNLPVESYAIEEMMQASRQSLI